MVGPIYALKKDGPPSKFLKRGPHVVPKRGSHVITSKDASHIIISKNGPFFSVMQMNLTYEIITICGPKDLSHKGRSNLLILGLHCNI